jgi:hypothetical protein
MAFICNISCWIAFRMEMQGMQALASTLSSFGMVEIEPRKLGLHSEAMKRVR